MQRLLLGLLALVALAWAPLAGAQDLGAAGLARVHAASGVHAARGHSLVDGSFQLASLTLTGAGKAGAGVVFPTPTGLTDLGDSRIQLSVGLPGTGTAVITSVGNGHGYGGAFYNAIDNALRSSLGYNYGVTSSTSRSAEYRLASASIAATGNPALAETGATADAKYSVAALGDAAITAHPANVVFFMGLINDFTLDSNGFFAADGGGSAPLGIMKSAARIFDALGAADKQVFVGETPKGKSTIWLETRAVASATFTASNTTGFVGAADFPTPTSEVITAAGAVLTKVASAPGPGQYAVTSGGVYTVDSGLNGTNVYITYSYGSANQTSVAMRDVNEWLQSSSASPFVAPTSGNSYAIAGAQFGRSFVHYVDTWGALLDSGTGDARNGTLNDGLHPGHAGVTLAAAAFRTAFLSVYPSQTVSLRNPPTVGNQEVGNSGGAARYSRPAGLGGAVDFAASLFDTSSPPAASAIRFTYGPTTSAGPTIVTATDLGNGYYRLVGAALDTSSNGPDAAPTRNFIKTSDKSWDLTLTATTAGRLYFERDFTNFVPNALFQTDHGTGTKTAAITGTAPGNWTISTSDTALGGTLTVALSTGTEPTTGKNALIVDINGLAGTGGGISITTLNSPIANRTIPANSPVLVAGGYMRIEPGTNGHLYGIYSAHNRIAYTVGGSATLGGYTGVTSVGADTLIGTAGFPMTDIDLSGGAIVERVLSPPVTIASPMTVTAPSFLYSIQYQPSKPVSARVYITEAELRIQGFWFVLAAPMRRRRRAANDNAATAERRAA